MWPPWSNSATRPSNRSRTFSCSSFKDIQALVKETPLHHSTHSPTFSIFHRVRISTSVLRALSRPSPPPPPPPPHPHPHPCDTTIIVYFTSLRVVRKTFQDCWSVRSILRGFGVPIDERDLSMDDGFRAELQGILGKGRKLVLPCVVIDGRFVGGAEEVGRMNETGELKRLIGSKGLPMVAVGSGVCRACGGVRFVVCEECSGSHKVFGEKSGFRSCTACNVSGLIRCSLCSAGQIAGTELVVRKMTD